jgi:hypothetical protein
VKITNKEYDNYVNSICASGENECNWNKQIGQVNESCWDQSVKTIEELQSQLPSKVTTSHITTLIKTHKTTQHHQHNKQ